MRRDRPGASKQPRSARGSGSDGPPHTGSALNHALRLTGKRWWSRVPGGSRAHPGNVGEQVVWDHVAGLLSDPVQLRTQFERFLAEGAAADLREELPGGRLAGGAGP